MPTGLEMKTLESLVRKLLWEGRQGAESGLTGVEKLRDGDVLETVSEDCYWTF